MNCPVCNNFTKEIFRKKNVQYYKCDNCTMVFSDELPNDNLVGGTAEIERNTQQNHLRIARVDEMSLGMKKEDVYILDFGSGTGYLVQDLINHGYVNTTGYDAYNPKFQRLPEKGKYHIIICVETAEHFSKPFIEFDVMYRSLLPGGIACIETGYLDATREDGISDEDNPYINPDAGHSTIYTHHAMDLLMVQKGFTPRPRFNRHCLLYQKIVK